MSFQVRPATRKELDIMVEWATKEGWNPGPYDADAFYATDPKGFLLGFLDDQPIACISAVSYGPSFGFLGFYITTKEFRNQGYGIQVWNKAINYFKTQNIGLDGVVEQQENYKKSGFELAYNNARYQFNSRKFNQDDQNMEKVFATARMYTKKFPTLPIDRIYGVTTFELG